MSRLSVAQREHFAARVDALLVRQVGSTWSVRPVSERLRRLLNACSRGLALGIEQEVYLAQFALLHLIAGEPFRNRSDAVRSSCNDTVCLSVAYRASISGLSR